VHPEDKFCLYCQITILMSQQLWILLVVNPRDKDY